MCFLVFAALLTGCSKQPSEKEKMLGSDTITGTYTQDTTGMYTGDSLTYATYLQRGDSTDIYGTGYYDYRDTLESFHDGYSKPRDSVYKVYNIKAFERLNYLIRLDSTKPGPYLDRGNHFQNIKMYEEAIRDYDRYIAKVQTNHSGYMNRGNAHERLKHFDKALNDYDSVIILKPRDTIAYYNKGVVFDYLKMYDSAVVNYSKAIEIDPRLAKAYYNRGIAFRNLKQYANAKRDWEMAIRLNPKYEAELRERINALGKI
jgi:tetratricopeptide (TPR) repeat protein